MSLLQPDTFIHLTHKSTRGNIVCFAHPPVNIFGRPALNSFIVQYLIDMFYSIFLSLTFYFPPMKVCTLNMFMFSSNITYQQKNAITCFNHQAVKALRFTVNTIKYTAVSSFNLVSPECVTPPQLLNTAVRGGVPNFAIFNNPNVK